MNPPLHATRLLLCGAAFLLFLFGCATSTPTDSGDGRKAMSPEVVKACHAEADLVERKILAELPRAKSQRHEDAYRVYIELAPPEGTWPVGVVGPALQRAGYPAGGSSGGHHICYGESEDPRTRVNVYYGMVASRLPSFKVVGPEDQPSVAKTPAEWGDSKVTIVVSEEPLPKVASGYSFEIPLAAVGRTTS